MPNVTAIMSTTHKKEKQERNSVPTLPSGGCPRFYYMPSKEQEGEKEKKPYESGIEINLVSIRDILGKHYNTEPFLNA